VGLRHYPCQICLPQAQCTVSVGTLFVSCCLQTGQGLVITYVINLAAHFRPNLLVHTHVLYQKSCGFALRPQDWEVPEVVVHVSWLCAILSAPMPLLIH
jgi:hypothetical protein